MGKAFPSQRPEKNVLVFSKKFYQKKLTKKNPNTNMQPSRKGA